MNTLEIVCLASALIILMIILAVVFFNKDKFTHLPGLVTFPPNPRLPPRSLEINVPLGNGKSTEGLELERYSLDNPQKMKGLIDFKQAYLDPPNLLQLPPNKPLVPPSKKKLHEVSGIPQDMYIGSDYMYSEYTPDFLCCKSGVI